MEIGTTVLHSLHIFNTLDHQKNTHCTLHTNSISCPQWILHLTSYNQQNCQL